MSIESPHALDRALARDAGADLADLRLDPAAGAIVEFVTGKQRRERIEVGLAVVGGLEPIVFPRSLPAGAYGSRVGNP